MNAEERQSGQGDDRPRSFGKRKAVLGALAVVAFFGVLEVALRAANFTFELSGKAHVFPGNCFQNYYRKHPIWFWEFQPDLVLPDPQRGFAYVINEQSLRASQAWQKRIPSEAFRVVCLGDSCTFGMPLSERVIYPERLRVLLAERLGERTCQVINAGVPGYSSYQGMRLLDGKFSGWDIDFVTVCFGPNDRDAAFAYGDSEQPSERLLSMRRALEHCRVYQGMALAIAWGLQAHAIARKKPIVPLTEDEWRKGHDLAGRIRRRVQPWEMVANYERLADQGRRQGFRVLFMTCPYRRRPNHRRTRFNRVLDRYNDAVREWSERTGAMLVDVDALFCKSGGDALFVHNDPIHPNAQGHSVIAEAIVAAMQRGGVLEGG